MREKAGGVADRSESKKIGSSRMPGSTDNILGDSRWTAINYGCNCTVVAPGPFCEINNHERE